MKKTDFPIGQKVPGYGLLNEFGEFDFIPEQTGSRQGQTKLIKSNEDFTLSETKKKILVHVRLDKKAKKLELLKEFCTIMSNILNALKEYDF